MDHDGVVFVERLDGLATVVLNRPDKLNALNKETVSYTHLTLPTTPYV